MPFAPDYSDYIRMKRVQKEATADSQLSSTKKRSTYAFGSYDPTYQLTRLPYNLFTPGRLTIIPVPPATGLNYEGYDCSATAPVIGTSASYGTRADAKLALLGVPGATDGEIVPYWFINGNTTRNNIAVHFTGYFRAPETGSYVFTASSDDGFQMYLNGTLIVDSTDGDAVAEPMKSSPLGEDQDSEPISLTKGTYYPIDALWANGSGALQLSITNVKVNGADIMPTTPFYSCLYKTIPAQLPPPAL